jgi:hypothetical protein
MPVSVSLWDALMTNCVVVCGLVAVDKHYPFRRVGEQFIVVPEYVVVNGKEGLVVGRIVGSGSFLWFYRGSIRRLYDRRKDHLLIQLTYTDKDQPWYNDMASIYTAIELPSLIEGFIADLAPCITRLVREIGAVKRREAAERLASIGRWLRGTSCTAGATERVIQLVREEIRVWRAQDQADLETSMRTTLTSIPEYVRLETDVAKYERLRRLVDVENKRRVKLEEHGRKDRPRIQLDPEWCMPLNDNELNDLTTALYTDRVATARLHHEIEQLTDQLCLTSTAVPFDKVLNEMTTKQRAIREEVAPNLVRDIDEIQVRRQAWLTRVAAERNGVEVYLTQAATERMTTLHVTDLFALSTDERFRLLERAVDELRRRVVEK